MTEQVTYDERGICENGNLQFSNKCTQDEILDLQRLADEYTFILIICCVFQLMCYHKQYRRLKLLKILLHYIG